MEKPEQHKPAVCAMRYVLCAILVGYIKCAAVTKQQFVNWLECLEAGVSGKGFS